VPRSRFGRIAADNPLIANSAPSSKASNSLKAGSPRRCIEVPARVLKLKRRDDATPLNDGFPRRMSDSAAVRLR